MRRRVLAVRRLLVRKVLAHKRGSVPNGAWAAQLGRFGGDLRQGWYRRGRGRLEYAGSVERRLVGEPGMQIREDDLTGPEIAALLREHLRGMHALSPPESIHALDLEGLRAPEITFWTVWDSGELLGCGALKELDAQHGEIKSMRTARAHLRKGVASVVLRHIMGEAERRGYARLSLETGSMAGFDPARSLYGRFGFAFCGPFGSYADDPNSMFMTRVL